MAGQGVGRYGAGLAAILALPPAARAQVGRFDVAISSAPSPVGAGARATGVGSAFIALADDATAASWNPGGLVQLERPEVSVVGLGLYQTDHVPRSVSEDDGLLEDDRVGTSVVGAAHLDYLSVAVPFAWGGRNVVASLNYQQTFSFDRAFSLRYEQTRPESFSTADGTFEQGGALYAISPAFAVEILPELSLGVAVSCRSIGPGSRSRCRGPPATRTPIVGSPTTLSEVGELRSHTSPGHFGLRILEIALSRDLAYVFFALLSGRGR